MTECFDPEENLKMGTNLNQVPCENEKSEKDLNSRQKISKWLGRNIRIVITDGRTLIGTFLCTDKARNVILGSAQEYRTLEETNKQVEPRMLGLAMVPGKHIVSLQVDLDT